MRPIPKSRGQSSYAVDLGPSTVIFGLFRSAELLWKANLALIDATASWGLGIFRWSHVALGMWPLGMRRTGAECFVVVYCCGRVGGVSDIAGVVQHTVIRGDLPALVVVHDDEGDWLVGDGVNDPNEDGACGIYHFGHLVQLDPTVAQVLDLPPGQVATRDGVESPWEISRWEYES